MTMLARIEEDRRGGVAIARIMGEVDASNTGWLGTRLRGLPTNRSDPLAIDIRGTTYLDSAGIALLFQLAGELRLHQQRLHLIVDEGSPVARMVHLTGLDGAVTTAGSLAEALGAD